MTSWVENEGNGYITRMDKTISEILVGAIERMARVAVNVLTILAPDCTIVFGSMFENTSIYKLFMRSHRANMDTLVSRQPCLPHLHLSPSGSMM